MMTLLADRMATGVTLVSVCLLTVNGVAHEEKPDSVAAPGATPTVMATVTPTAETEISGQTGGAARMETVVPKASSRATASPVPTMITIHPAGRLVVGERPKVIARLTTRTGRAVPDAPVQLYLDGVSERRTRTDDAGVASFPIRHDRRAATYAFEVVFGGLPGFMPSEASTELVIHPARLEVHTVPSLSGVQFSLDGRVFSSAEDGIAQIEVDRTGIYRLEVLSMETIESGFRARFRRWGDAFTLSREVRIPRDGALEVGFDVSHRVSQEFVDLAGQTVDPARVTSITLKSSVGAVHTLDNIGPHWLQAGRVVRRTFGLEETKVQYSVESVIVRGSDVVNRAQQRFFLQADDQWQIQLLLYSVRISARDALFGFPIGRAILLEHPDGRWERHALGPGAELTLDSLPRGQYRATVESAWGLSPVVPLALSRNQDAPLLVVSYLDISTSVLAMTSVALGLLFVGRPHMLRGLRARVPVTRWDWRLDWAGDLRPRLARGLRESLARPIQVFSLQPDPQVMSTEVAAENLVEEQAEIASAMERIDQLPVESLNLSRRIGNTLRRAGIVRVGQIFELLEDGDEHLLSIQGFGEKSLEELKRVLDGRRYVRKKGSVGSRSRRGS